jgi:flavin reductase (DIM6/NTAB) family NADH-FMN oxidoreductase RutF
MFNTYTNLENANHSQPRVAALLACKDNLMPVSWHMPISKSPFRYAVAIREENYTHALLKAHGSFTLNFLPFKHYGIVDKLGHIHGNTEDKLALSQLKKEGEDANKNVLLSDSDFIYQCVVCDTYKNGDHTIFIANVLKIHVSETQSAEPMLFSGRGRYATLGKSATVQK